MKIIIKKNIFNISENDKSFQKQNNPYSTKSVGFLLSRFTKDKFYKSLYLNELNNNLYKNNLFHKSKCRKNISKN